jgi:hypothetical protein
MSLYAVVERSTVGPLYVYKTNMKAPTVRSIKLAFVVGLPKIGNLLSMLFSCVCSFSCLPFTLPPAVEHFLYAWVYKAQY